MQPSQRLAPYRQHAQRLIDLGYTPVPLRPGAKVPAIKHWASLTPDQARDLIESHGDHNTGLLTAGLAALDIDVLDQGLAKILRDWCLRHVARYVPARVGSHPKMALIFRCAEGSLPKRSSAMYRDAAGREHRIEVLGAGQQLAVYGLHPDTGQPYMWPQRDICGHGVHFDDLPAITEEQVQELFALFDREADSRSWERVARAADGTGSDDSPMPVSGLTLELAEEAIAAYTNDDLHYDDWLRVGLALHHQFDGAVEAFEVWDAWSANSSKYSGPEIGWKRWQSFRVDHAGGVSMRSVLMEAEDAGWTRPQSVEGARIADEDDFPGLPEASAPGAADESWLDEAEAPDAEEFDADPEPEPDVLTLMPGAFTFDAGFSAASIPKRRWVVSPLMIAGHVTVCAGPPGVSKSVVDLTRAISIATGTDLLGEHIACPGPVLAINNEDPRDEIERRVAAICLRYGVSPASLDGRLFIVSGYGSPKKYAERKGLHDSVRPTTEATRLVNFARAAGLVAIVVDPLISTAANVNENSNDDQDQIVSVWKKIANATGSAVSLTHHTRKGSGGDSEGHAGDMDSIRGAGAIMGAARFGFTLARMSRKSASELGIPWSEARRLVRLDSAKGNYALPDEQARWLRLDSQPIDNGEEIGVPSPIDLDDIERTEEADHADLDTVERKTRRGVLVELMASQLKDDGGFSEISINRLAERWMVVANVQKRQGRTQLQQLIPEGEAEDAITVPSGGSNVRVWRTLQGEGRAARNVVYFLREKQDQGPGEY